MKTNFDYNPFSGILADDIAKVLVPRFDIENFISKIKSQDSTAIEFLGKKGRGKTTHLIFLQKCLPEYPIFLLNNSSKSVDVCNSQSDVVFVDSIHHLNLFQRIKLFKEKKTVIYTTHFRRQLECIMAGMPYVSFNFNGINSDILFEILEKRIRLASNNDAPLVDGFEKKEVERLIKTHGDDYRAIINHLYKKYQ